MSTNTYFWIFPTMALLCLHLSCPILKEYISQGLDPYLARPILEELHVHCLVVGCLKFCNILSTNPLCPHKLFVTPCSLMNIHLDRDHIRHLSIDADSDKKASPTLVAYALTILPTFTQLRVVDILVDYPDDPRLLAGKNFTQNSICCLSLHFVSSKILSHITMPHLEALTLWETYCESKNHLILFLRRSACPLKFMFWKPSYALPLEQIFDKVFQYTPHLEELELHVGKLSSGKTGYGNLG